MRRRTKGHYITFMLGLSLVWVVLPILARNVRASSDSIAIVNGSAIARDEYNRELGQVRKRISRQNKFPSESQLSEIKKRILEQLIGRELLYQQSQRMGVKVKASEINERFESLKKRFTNESEFNNVLHEQNFSEDVVKAQFKRGIAIKQLIDSQIVPKVKVTDKETKSFYGRNPQYFKKSEQVRASHILVKVDPNADELQKAEARKKLEDIQQELSQGKDFSDLARVFSEGPSSTKGGDLGYFERNQMVKPFEEAAFSLKPGRISKIVQTNFGYHLIKVIDKKPESIFAYEEIKNAISRDINRKKIEKEVNRYIEELKKDADVQRFLE